MKLRAIDNGTRYEVAGRLRWMARAIERGEFGDVRNIVLGMQAIYPGGAVDVSAFHFGKGDIPTAAYIFEAAKKQIV